MNHLTPNTPRRLLSVVDLCRDDVVIIQRGKPRTPNEARMAHAKLARFLKTMPAMDKSIDTVAEVRKLRDSIN
ncbi:hypothetical protein [Delftia acidovorans]